MAIRKQSKTRVKPSTKKNTKAVSTSRLRNGKTVVITHNKEGEGGDIETIELTADHNGSFYAPAGKAFSKVTVNVGEYLKPGLNVSIDPATRLYDITVDKLNQIFITANVKKNTNPISKIEFFINNVSQKVITEGVADGGIFSCTKKFEPATNSNLTIKVIVFDSATKDVSVTMDIKFVGKTYYGVLASDITSPDETMIKGLSSTLTGAKNYVYSGITTDYGKICYAYPAAFGDLTSIKDTINNLQYMSTFTKKQINIDSIAYNCYTQTDPSAADNVQLSFS